MHKLILAVSPDTTLLEQISAHLQEGGRYLVTCAANGKEALTAIGKQSFDLAILDAEVSDLPFVPLTRELVALQPALKLLVYPPQNNLKHPVLSGLVANGYLNKPFFGPEVSEKIVQALNENETKVTPNPYPQEDLPRMWVEHPDAGFQQIEQMLAATTASSGLLMLHGQVIAGSGALPEETGQNVVNFLTRYWTNIQSGELFRYLKMDHGTSTYLIYAVPLIKEVAIALVYHTNVALLDIRGEVNRLRKAFLGRYTNTGELRREFSVQPLTTTTTSDTPFVASSEKNFSNPSTNIDGLEEPQFPEDIESNEPALNENDLNNLDAMLKDMPPPDPEELLHPLEKPIPAESVDWIPGSDLNDFKVEIPFARPEAVTPADTQPVQSHSADLDLPGGKTAPLPKLHKQPVVGEPQEFPDFDFKLPWEEGNFSKPISGSAFPLPLPGSSSRVELPAEFQPYIPQAEETFAGNAADVRFKYTCIMLPGNPRQFLTHELAELLNRSLPQLHFSYGWDFTAISIRPLYLQWSVTLPPNVCLHEMVQEIRRRTNTQIFAAFPGLLNTHPSGDFWSPGFYAVSGAHFPSNRLINDFISLSRQVSTDSLPF